MVVGIATSTNLMLYQETAMRSLLLFFLGIPIPIIILIALFT